eukprot:15356225-Alexandrium_andersonii.AAC.1
MACCTRPMRSRRSARSRRLDRLRRACSSETSSASSRAMQRLALRPRSRPPARRCPSMLSHRLIECRAPR